MMFESAYSSTSTSYDNDDWVSTLNSSSKKWCRYSSTTSYGYIWDKTNSSSYCGGYSYSRCSDDGSYYLPQNAKKLLCPTDSYYCSSSQSTSLYYSTSTAYFYSYSVPTSRVCWYKITPSSYSITSIKIEIKSLSKASAEVYLESTTNTFTYKGSLSNGGDLTVSVSSYDPVWVLITPTSNYASASIKASASSSSSSSSSSSDYSTTDTSTIMIAVFTSVGGFIVLIVIFLVICRCIHLQKQRNFHLQNANAAARVLNTHQPAIAYNQYAVYQVTQSLPFFPRFPVLHPLLAKPKQLRSDEPPARALSTHLRARAFLRAVGARPCDASLRLWDLPRPARGGPDRRAHQPDAQAQQRHVVWR